MKEKKFQNLRYDLGENIVYHDDFQYAFQQLTHLSAYEVCSSLYMKSNIIEHLMKWYETERKEYKIDEMMKKFEEILKTFDEEIPKGDVSARSYIKKGFGIMGREILNFLKDFKDKVLAHCFIRNFIFTNQGTINLKKTVVEILEKEKQLEPESKFKLVCKFFLDDQLIENYFKILPKPLQKQYLKSSEFMSFCIWCNKNQKHVFSSLKPAKDEVGFLDLNFEEILNRSINERNGVEVQYLWENFISKRSDSENILQKILPDLLITSENLGIFFYLLFQLENNHGEFFNEYFKTEGLQILKKIYEEERWQNIFIEVFKVIYLHLEEKSHKEIIYFLTHSSEDLKEESLHFLKGISEAIAPSVKSYLAQENTTFYYSVLKDLFKNKKIEFAEFIFKIIGRGNFYIFLNEEGVTCFEELLKLKMFDYVDNIIKEIFSMADSAKLKKALEKLVLPICCHYSKKGDWGGIEKFLQWMYTDDKFKEKINGLLYQGQGDLIRSFFYKTDICENDLGNIDNFLLGCLESERKVNEYKRHIVVVDEILGNPNSAIDYKTIKDFVLSSNFRGLDFLLVWCLLNTDNILGLKERLLNDSDLLNTIILKENMSELLNSFVSFCTNSPHDYMNFQLKILKDTELHIKLFESEQYYAAKNLINWCSDFYEEETQELKEKLFPIVITQFVCHSTNSNEFEDFKEWINISWITFIKCHFTAIGINIFSVNENFLHYHLHFLQKFWSFLNSPFKGKKNEMLALTEA